MLTRLEKIRNWLHQFSDDCLVVTKWTDRNVRSYSPTFFIMQYLAREDVKLLGVHNGDNWLAAPNYKDDQQPEPKIDAPVLAYVNQHKGTPRALALQNINERLRALEKKRARQ